MLDIDRPEITYGPGEQLDPERELEADTARDQVLAQVWDAFGFDQNKQPVVMRSPGDGYHVYLPLSRGEGAQERTWPAAWAREHIEHHLNQHGIELRPGRLELFPSGIRLRAPCGAGSALLSPTRPDFSDDLGLELRHASWRSRRTKNGLEPALVRDIGPLTAAFCGAIEAARRPLEDWLGTAVAGWHSTWGPWGKDPDRRQKKPETKPRVMALSQHKEEVPKVMGALPRCSPSASSNPLGTQLLYGSEFRGRIRDLTECGITSLGERHDSSLKLTWYWGCCRGLEEDATIGRVREWLTAFEHTSATRLRSAHAFVRDTLREARHYYQRTVARSRKPGRVLGADYVLLPLPSRDTDVVLPQVVPEVRSEVETLLRFLRSNSDKSGRVPHPVNLSAQILHELLGERRVRVTDAEGNVQRRRASVMAIEELTELGILALHTDYSTAHHGRLYTCWYKFGSGALPRRVDEVLVLAERDVEEGRLQVVSNGAAAIAVRLAPTRSPSTLSSPWWVRMYQRRAFTPAEFFEADDRKVLPGPFRHRRRAGELELGESATHPPPPSPPPPPPPAPPVAQAAAPTPVDRSLHDSAPPPPSALDEHIARAWNAWLKRRE